jgi:hypothetical protein
MNVWNVEERVYANTTNYVVFVKIVEEAVFANIINGVVFVKNVGV